MVKYMPTTTAARDPLSATFAALADPTRRAILARLCDGDAQVGEIARPFDMSLPAVSKHLSVLEDAGLIVRERAGRVRRCHLRPETLRAAADWIEHYRQFWEGQFDALADFLSHEQTEAKGNQKGENDGGTTENE